MSPEYRPDPKVAAAAIAALVAWLLQVVTGVNAPAGIESAVAVVVAYVIPSTRTKPLE